MLTVLTVDPLWDGGVTDMGPHVCFDHTFTRSVFLEMDSWHDMASSDSRVLWCDMLYYM